MCRRFMEKVDQSGNCWLWLGCKQQNRGYGMFYFNGRFQGAHRASWQIHKGEIPDNLCVLHACDNPSCVNPEHLFLGTQKDNMRDRKKKGRFRGRQVFGVKLTESDVLAIRSSKENNAALGRRYGVYRSTIRSIKIGRTWAHV